MNQLRHQPLDIVTACRLKDLHILKLAAQNLPRFVPFKKLHVLTARPNFPQFARILGPEVALIDEDTFIPGLTLAQLRALAEPGFPQGAGWYFQQFLKFGFAFQVTGDDLYLIWDADTVPLRPMEFFDDQGRMLFTTATISDGLISEIGRPPSAGNTLVSSRLQVALMWCALLPVFQCSCHRAAT